MMWVWSVRQVSTTEEKSLIERGHDVPKEMNGIRINGLSRNASHWLAGGAQKTAKFFPPLRPSRRFKIVVFL